MFLVKFLSVNKIFVAVVVNLAFVYVFVYLFVCLFVYILFVCLYVCCCMLLCMLLHCSAILSAVDDFEEELDEDIAVQNVIRNMLDKKVVEQHITSDLGFDELKKRRDPLTKMELRHKQVNCVELWLIFS